MDLLAPALLAAPGAALVTLTKAEDLYLTVDARAGGGRPVVVLELFGLAPGCRSRCGIRLRGVGIRWWPSGGRRRSPEPVKLSVCVGLGVGLVEVVGEAVGVGEGECAECGFPAGDGGAFDEAGGCAALAGG